MEKFWITSILDQIKLALSKKEILRLLIQRTVARDLQTLFGNRSIFAKNNLSAYILLYKILSGLKKLHAFEQTYLRWP